MKRGRIVSLGVFLMDMFPVRGGVGLEQVEAFCPMPGGACANVAAAAAKLGADSRFIGKVGEDAFGHILKRYLERYGVNVSGLVWDKESRTTLNFHAMPDKDTIEYLFYRNPGADANLTAEEVDWDAVRQADVIHMDSLCLTASPIRETAFEVMKEAGKAGTAVSFDFNYRDVLWRSEAEAVGAVRRVLQFVDIFKLNETEYRLMGGGSALDTGLGEILESGPQICIVTRGKEGSTLRTSSDFITVPAMRVDAVDTVGCGDAYIAAFLSALIRSDGGIWDRRRESLAEAGLFADTAAALTALKEGAMPALPEYGTVMEYLGRRQSMQREETGYD